MELPPQKPGSLRLMAMPQNQGRLVGVDIFHTGIGYGARFWDLNHMSGLGTVIEPGKRSQVLGTRFNVICQACIPQTAQNPPLSQLRHSASDFDPLGLDAILEIAQESELAAALCAALPWVC